MKRQKKLPPRNRSADPCPWSAARELHFWTFKDAFRAWSAILVLFYVLFHCEFKASSNRRLIFQDITSRYWQPSRSPQTWLIVAFGLQYNVKISSCHAGNLQLKVFSGLTTGLHLLHFPLPLNLSFQDSLLQSFESWLFGPDQPNCQELWQLWTSLTFKSPIFLKFGNF